MPRLLRDLEVWTDLECLSGTRVAVFSSTVSATETEEDRYIPVLEVEVPESDTAASEVLHERVLRLHTQDDAVTEYRVKRIKRRLGVSGTMMIVEAHGVLGDLATREQPLQRVEANGDASHEFGAYGKTPSQHMDLILREVDAMWTKGAVAFTDRIDIDYQEDTPLSALNELARQCSVYARIELVRDGANGYTINLVDRETLPAASLLVADAKNLINLDYESDGTELGTVCVPRGGQEYGGEAGIADAEWLPDTIQSDTPSAGQTTITFTEDLLGEDDQLVGLYLRDPNGAHHEILDSTAPATIVVDGAPTGFTGIRRGKIRRYVSNLTVYANIASIASPSGVNAYGERAFWLERGEIPPVDNLMPNPYLDEGWGSVPTGWAAVGSPTIAQNTDDLYLRHGGSNAHVTAAENEGIETTAIDVILSEQRPFLVCQAMVYVVSGHVRMELEDVTNAQTYPAVAKDAVTLSNEEWIENFGLGPEPNSDPDGTFYDLGTTQVKVRFIAYGGAAEFYLDTTMLLQQPSFSEVLFAGRASNELWKLGLKALAVTKTPALKFDVNVIDLQRLGDTATVVDEIALHAAARLTVPEFSLDHTARIIRIERDLLTAGNVKMKVEDKTNDLSELVAEETLRVRRKYSPLVGGDLPEISDTVPADPANVVILYTVIERRLSVSWDTATGARWYEVRHNTTLDWATATYLTRVPAPPANLLLKFMPRGKYFLLVKAGNDAGESANYASAYVYAFPWTERDVYRDDQKRKRPGGDSVARWGPGYDKIGTTVLWDENGVIDGMMYDDADGNLVNVLRPVEGAAQRNFTRVVIFKSNGGTYSAPTGYTIRGACYLSGGLSRQAASVWDPDPDLPDEDQAEPDSYAQAPEFDIDGASMDISLLLKERVNATYTTRTKSFLDNTLTFAGDETGVAAPASSVLPAYDNRYWTDVSGSLSSDKSGTYQIRLSLQMRTNGGTYQQKDEVTLEGTLPDADLAATLAGYISGWDGTGDDDAKVVVEDVSAPGNWALSLTVGPLTWVEVDTGGELYASMTPNGETCEIEVLLEATS